MVSLPCDEVLLSGYGRVHRSEVVAEFGPKTSVPRWRDANNFHTAADRVQRLVPRVDALLEGPLEGAEGHGLGGRDVLVEERHIPARHRRRRDTVSADA